MRIMIGIGHPKQVHFWRNIINNLEEDGHEVKIVAWKKDITLYLLNVYGLTYEIVGKNYKGLMRKMYGLLESDFKAFKVAIKFKPDILLAGSPALAHVSKLLRKPYIYFIDTEHASIAYWLTYPFSDVICTPSCFKKRINSKKRITFDGYGELAYLHPKYFKPDSSVLEDLGLSKDDKFIIVRFVSWSASHDVGHRWFSFEEGYEFIRHIENYGRVFITSESPLPRNLKQYYLPLQAEKIHHLLYYATMYIGGSGTMATESAILGTPSIHITSPTVINLGNFEELEKKYGLMYNFDDSRKALVKVLELLAKKDLKLEWQRRRRRLLNDKIDVTKFMTWFIEEYPESLYTCKEKGNTG